MGMRVIAAVGFPSNILTNKTVQQEWIYNKSIFIQENYYDGLNLIFVFKLSSFYYFSMFRINLDFEDTILCNQTDLINSLSEFVKLVYTTFKKLNPNYQVSFDTNSFPGEKLIIKKFKN